MNPETQISLVVIFSIIASISNIVSIYMAFSNKRAKERDHDEEVQQRIDEKFQEHQAKLEERSEDETQRRIENEKQFLKINMKLDSFSNDLRILTRNTDKTTSIMNQIQQHIILVDTQLAAHEKLLEEHSQRIHKLEEQNEEKH
jgi:Zn-dependent metalloprotease